MAKPRKPSSKLQSSNQLLDAINFLSCVTKDSGTPQETHIYLGGKYCTAYNEVLSAGMLINDEIIAAPNNKIFKAALSKCGQRYTLSIDGTKIIVKSNAFKAVVPCIDPSLLFSPLPDNPTHSIDDRLKPALEAAAIIKYEPNAQDVHLLALCLNGQSIISTDGKIIIEYWHGIELPTNLAIPKSIIPAILSNTKKLTQFGFSNNSVTFFFEDNSWVKSQLYAKPWPIDNCLSILNKPTNPSAIPPDFYKGLDAVAPFSDGTVYFERELLCSHKDINIGATYDVPGLPKGPIFNAKYLLSIRHLVNKIDFTVSANGVGKDGGYLLFFYGENVRGVIAGHG